MEENEGERKIKRVCMCACVHKAGKERMGRKDRAFLFAA